jgi:ABC-2 type transport system permease protein
MNAQSNTVAESLAAQETAVRALSVTRPFYWSVRRELWENRAIYIAPLIVAGVTLFAFLFATIARSLLTPDLNQRLARLEEPYDFAAGVILATVFIVGVFYCLDALHGERRDRSILFWKSLPVSDLTTVLAKASIPFVVVPLVGFAVTVATQLIMLLLSTPVVLASGLGVATLWNKVSLVSNLLGLFNHLFFIHILWYAPIYCWMLLVSAWARRATLLWAVIPPLAIGVFEKIVFNTTHFAQMVQYRFTGPPVFEPPGHESAMVPQHDLVRFLSTPGLWIGFAVALVFFVATVRIRRYRGPV